MAKKRRRPAKKRTENRVRKTEKQSPKAAQKKRPTTAASAKPEVQTQRSSPPTSHPSSEYSYVGREIRQIVLITAFFVGVQIALWAVFGRTGLEEKLIRLIAL